MQEKRRDAPITEGKVFTLSQTCRNISYSRYVAESHRSPQINILGRILLPPNENEGKPQHRVILLAKTGSASILELRVECAHYCIRLTAYTAFYFYEDWPLTLLDEDSC